MPSTPTSRSPLAPSRQTAAPARPDAFFSGATSNLGAPRGSLFCGASGSSRPALGGATADDAALLLELRAADELELAAPLHKRARRAERDDGAHAVAASHVLHAPARPLMRPGDASPEHLRRLERLVASEEKAEKEKAARSKSSPARPSGL